MTSYDNKEYKDAALKAFDTEGLKNWVNECFGSGHKELTDPLEFQKEQDRQDAEKKRIASSLKHAEKGLKKYIEMVEGNMTAGDEMRIYEEFKYWEEKIPEAESYLRALESVMDRLRREYGIDV